MPRSQEAYTALSLACTRDIAKLIAARADAQRLSISEYLMRGVAMLIDAEGDADVAQHCLDKRRYLRRAPMRMARWGPEALVPGAPPVKAARSAPPEAGEEP